jgi:hypothetical protein
VLKEKHVQLRLTDATNSDSNDSWRRAIAHRAMAWRMAGRIAEERLLPGDLLEIAFSLDHNDHPEFGGIELSLRDFKSAARAQATQAAK